jgi:hypothetical protein
LLKLTLEQVMPNIKEMESALKKIRNYSRSYKGPHSDFFAQLHESTRSLPDRQSRNFENYITSLYQYAINSLVTHIDPPSIVTLKRVCDDLSRVAEARIEDIEIIIPGNNESRQPQATRSRLDGQLSKLLPKARKFNEKEHHILSQFREHLPPSSSLVKNGDRNAEQN